MMKHIFAWIIWVVLASALSGCGNGGKSPTASQPTTQNAKQTGQASFTIVWPEANKHVSRGSRVIPDIVASIRITVYNDSIVVGDRLFPRPTQGGQTSAALSGLPAGIPLTATVIAFPTAAGTGVPVAQASLPISIVANQTTQQPTITLNSTVDHVDVAPGTVTSTGQNTAASSGQPFLVTVGQTMLLIATPRDKDNNVVLIAPGNLTWNSDNPAIQIDSTTGQLTANQVGTANIVATVKVAASDPGISSPPFTVVAHVGIAFNPTAVVMTINQTVTFTATVTPTSSGGVTYSVKEANGGSINAATGTYTAPALPGTYHVIATSQADSTQNAVATVVVQEAPHAVISTSLISATVITQSTVTLAATVTGKSNTGVIWSIQESGNSGTLTANNDGTETYTAPTTPGTYHVTATSQADPTQNVTSTIVVQSPPVLPPPGVASGAIYVTLNSASLVGQNSLTLNAIVTGLPNTGVVWSIQESGNSGTLTANNDGTETYTAPTTPGTYHVTATSQADPTLTATATITVQAPGTSLYTNLSSALLFPRSTLSFKAIVTGLSNTSVVWSIQESGDSGTLTANNDGTETYTAPTTPGTYHVTATSQADPTLTATATIAVISNQQQSVVIIPVTATLTLRQTISFTAAVANTINSAVTWQIQESGGGTLSNQASNSTNYTAPDVPGIYHLIAVSQANPSLTATATITVKSGGVSLIVN